MRRRQGCFRAWDSGGGGIEIARELFPFLHSSSESIAAIRCFARQSKSFFGVSEIGQLRVEPGDLAFEAADLLFDGLAALLHLLELDRVYALALLARGREVRWLGSVNGRGGGSRGLPGFRHRLSP